MEYRMECGSMRYCSLSCFLGAWKIAWNMIPCVVSSVGRTVVWKIMWNYDIKTKLVGLTG